MTYIIIGIVISSIAAFLFNRNNAAKHVEKVVEFEREDAALEKESEILEEDIKELEAKLDTVEEKMKGMSPKEIEDYWNK